jgi:hypothetical protein
MREAEENKSALDVTAEPQSRRAASPRTVCQRDNRVVKTAKDSRHIMATLSDSSTPPDLEMSSAQSSAQSAPPIDSTPFTKAEQIAQLSSIDQGISALLRSAGLALKILTASVDPVDPDDPDDTAAFVAATTTYLDSVHAVAVLLKRNVLALGEAGIIAPDRDSAHDDSGAGGLGSHKSTLDVGWLNSRSGSVTRDLEASLWAEARRFAERIGRGGDVDAKGPDAKGPDLASARRG